MDPLDDVALTGLSAQAIGNLDPPHDQHTALNLHLTRHLTAQAAFSRRDPARLQRATKGSE